MRTLKKLNKDGIQILRQALTDKDMLLPDYVYVGFNVKIMMYEIIFLKKFGLESKQLNVSLDGIDNIEDTDKLTRQLEREFLKPKPLPKGTILVKVKKAKRKINAKD